MMIFKTDTTLADYEIDTNNLSIELVRHYFNPEMAELCATMHPGDKITYYQKAYRVEYYIMRVK